MFQWGILFCISDTNMIIVAVNSTVRPKLFTVKLLVTEYEYDKPTKKRTLVPRHFFISGFHYKYKLGSNL